LTTIAIIPARGGSKGVKNKNIRLLNNIPLIAYTIQAATISDRIDYVYVTTDHNEIGEVAHAYGAKVIKRPINLADDYIMPDASVVHAINNISTFGDEPDDIVVFLQPTSPIRLIDDIDNALDSFNEHEVDSLFSAVDIHPCVWRLSGQDNLTSLNFNYKERKRRQDDTADLIENGSIYIANTSVWKKYGERFGDNVGHYLMENICLYEIDTEKDLSMLDALMKALIQIDYPIVKF
jgi:CMP-N,N'-diacetyllegionaminic acid synthase